MAESGGFLQRASGLRQGLSGKAALHWSVPLPYHASDPFDSLGPHKEIRWDIVSVSKGDIVVHATPPAS